MEPWIRVFTAPPFFQDSYVPTWTITRVLFGWLVELGIPTFESKCLIKLNLMGSRRCMRDWDNSHLLLFLAGPLKFLKEYSQLLSALSCSAKSKSRNRALGSTVWLEHFCSKGCHWLDCHQICWLGAACTLVEKLRLSHRSRNSMELAVLPSLLSMPGWNLLTWGRGVQSVDFNSGWLGTMLAGEFGELEVQKP